MRSLPRSLAVTRVRNVERGTVLAEQLESADSLGSIVGGWRGRSARADGDGLWLAGSNGIHMMFMRFAIDAVFVGKPESDGTREVLSLHRALPPWRGVVWLVRGANGTLELPVGTIDRTSTAVGDFLTFG